MLTSPGIQVNVKLWKSKKCEKNDYGKIRQNLTFLAKVNLYYNNTQWCPSFDPLRVNNIMTLLLPPSSTWPQVSDQISIPQLRCIQGAKDTNIVSKNGSMIKHASHWRGTWILAPVLYDLMKTFRIMGKNYQDHIYME